MPERPEYFLSETLPVLQMTVDIGLSNAHIQPVRIQADTFIDLFQSLFRKPRVEIVVEPGGKKLRVFRFQPLPIFQDQALLQGVSVLETPEVFILEILSGNRCCTQKNQQASPENHILGIEFPESYK